MTGWPLSSSLRREKHVTNNDFCRMGKKKNYRLTASVTGFMVLRVLRKTVA